MKVYTITADQLRDKSARVLYPGVTQPGRYTYDENQNRFNPVHQNIEPINFDDITSGLGIGGAGSDDFNIHTEGDPNPDDTGYSRSAHRPGEQVYPAGTTMGIRGDANDHCARCGRPADWNPQAGMALCSRHWDEY